MHYESIRTVYSLKVESMPSFVSDVGNTSRGISLQSDNANHSSFYEIDTICESMSLVMTCLGTVFFI